MSKAVAYYRVSTQKQGKSGLGLDAQRAAVASFANDRYEILKEFTEIETGTAKRQRVEIYRAIDYAKVHDATLLIAKLDRLARSVSFTSALMDSGVEFIACDMPDANRLTIHIIAAIAEHEAKLISERTKAALARSKKQLGTPANLTHEAQLKGARVGRQKAVRAYRRAGAYASHLRNDGLSYRAVANALNENGFQTRKGKPFKAMTIKRILDRQL